MVEERFNNTDRPRTHLREHVDALDYLMLQPDTRFPLRIHLIVPYPIFIHDYTPTDDVILFAYNMAGFFLKN